MTRYYSDFVGGESDSVQLYLAEQDIAIYGSYEVKVAVMTQPAAFTVRIGWGNSAKDLLKRFRAGDPFQLKIGGQIIQSGRIEAVQVPTAKVTELEVKGRDWISPLFRSEIINERQFAATTIQELVQEVLKIMKLDDRTVFYDNGTNRKLMTNGNRVHRHPRGALVQSIDTGIVTSGGGKVEYQDVKCKVGETWFQWLDKQLRLAGLYMWATLEGNYVISAPNITQPPMYRLTRRRGQDRNEVNITDHAYRFDITNMHTSIVTFGRFNGSQCFGVAANKWCTGALGGEASLATVSGEPRAVFDDEIKNPKQAQWRANRAVSEEMRAGFHLSYTVAGHRLPSADATDQMAIVAPDTMTQLEDDELGFNSANDLGFGNSFWIDEITYRRSKDNGTTTSFDCVHPDSLKFLAEAAE